MVRFLSNLFSRRGAIVTQEHARATCRAAFDAAVHARDTRRQNETLSALQAATNAALRAELGR